MRILVTGAAGTIGSELVRQLCESDHTVYGIDINETGIFHLRQKYQDKGFDGSVNDVTHPHAIENLVRSWKPDIIYHAAAYKHVGEMEVSPTEAVRVNILGTQNVIPAAAQHGAKFVFISTDKVVEADSIMGATKRVAELMVRRAGYTAVRFGNVLGSRGSVIPIWQEQLDKDEPLTVTDEKMERYFMTIEEAVQLVIHAGENDSEGGHCYILDMGERVKVIDLAKDILKKAGKSPDNIKMIGARPGEAIRERLMTVDEEARATKMGKYWVL